MELKFQETPMIKMLNIPTYGETQRWLQINVTYIMAGDPKNKDRTAMQWLDDMTIKYEVILPSHYQGRKVSALLSGEVMYWCVAADGKKHRAMGLIDPKILKRYADDSLKLKGGDAKKIPVRVSFYDKNRRLFARAFALAGMNAAAVNNAFERAETELGVLKLPGTVFSRNETPWENLNWDRYELIKSSKR